MTAPPWPFAGALTVGGVSIETKTFGPPPAEAPTLVFLHEGLGSIAAWKDVPEQWATQLNLGCVVSSRGGYGSSSPAALPREASSLHDEAPVLAALLATLGVTRPVLVGHSDGASIALIYAGKKLEPRPLALVLEAPHVFVEDISITSIAAARSAFESGALGPRLARYHTLPVRDVFMGWNDVWLSAAFRSWTIEELLPAVDVPTLVIQGHDDPYGTAEQVRRIERAAPGPIRAHFLSDCGHAPHREKPSETLALVVAFLRDLSRST